MQVKRDSIRRTDGETARHGVARLHIRAISERSVLALLTIFFLVHALPSAAQDDDRSFRKKLTCVNPPNLRCSICHNASGEIAPGCALEVMRFTGKNNYAAAEAEVCRLRATGQLSRNIGITGALFLTGPFGAAGIATGGAGLEYLASGDACKAGKTLPFASLIDVPSNVCTAIDPDADAYDRCIAGLSAGASAFEILPFVNACRKWLRVKPASSLKPPQPLTPGQATFECLGGTKTGIDPTRYVDLPKKVLPNSISIVQFPIIPGDPNSIVGHSGILFWKDGKLYLAHLGSNGLESKVDIRPFKYADPSKVIRIIGEVGMPECQILNFWGELHKLKGQGFVAGYMKYDEAAAVIKGCGGPSFGNAAWSNCNAMTGEFVGKACEIGGHAPIFIAR